MASYLSQVQVGENTYHINPVIATENTSGTGAVTAKPYTAAIWRVNLPEITELYTGLTILYKVPVAGNGSYGTLLRINGTDSSDDNNTNLYPVCANVTTMIGTRYAVNCIVALTFDANLYGQKLYYNSNSAYTTTASGTGWKKKGCWKISDYNADTKTTAGTSEKVDTKLFLVGGASQSSSGVTTYSNSGVYIGTDNCLYSNDEKTASEEYVNNAIDALPEPMVFRGTLGSGGTISSLPVDGSADVGDTYKVITAGTYAGQSAKVGDTFICDSKTSSANTWVRIPSGDELDILVKLTLGSNNATYPILASAQSNPTSGTAYEAIYDTGIKINPNKHSVAEGYQTTASGERSHAEGLETTASGANSHAEGEFTTALSGDAHAEGVLTIAYGQASHAEGSGNPSIPVISGILFGWTANSTTINASENPLSKVVVGSIIKYDNQYRRVTAVTSTTLTVDSSFGEAANNVTLYIVRGASGNYSHVEGYGTIAQGTGAHAEGYNSNVFQGAIGDYSHVEGNTTKTGAAYAHAEGSITYAGGEKSHAEGYSCATYGEASHAEGWLTVALNKGSHAEGYSSIVNGALSSNNRTADLPFLVGNYGHAEGNACAVAGHAGHAEGIKTFAKGVASHAEGSESIASGDYSHAWGDHTIADKSFMTAIGSYNGSSSNGDLFAIGNGTSSTRKTIFNVGSATGTTGGDAIVTVTGKVNASEGFFQTSDKNQKNIISDLSLEKAYDLIDKCQTIIYTLKDDKDNKEQIGLIAQEVNEFFPEIVSTDKDGLMSLDYAKLTVVILKVLKDLISRVSKLEKYDSAS